MTNQRLRQARELKGWGIEDMARHTGLRRRTLEAIEEGHFAELPAGVYCRSSIRSYASAVGLNPEEVLESLGPLLPVPEDPLDGLARRHGHFRKAEPNRAELPGPPAPPVARVAPQVEPGALPPDTDARSAGLELIIESEPQAPESPADVPLTAGQLDSASAKPLGEVLHEPVMRMHAPYEAEAVDVVLAPACADAELAGDAAVMTGDEPMAPVERPGREWWRPVAASAVDGLLLSAMGVVLVWLTAIACDISIAAALRVAAPALALVFALIVSLYFLLFGGVGDATPGVMMVRPAARPPQRTMLNARAVFGRARRSLFHDDSLLMD